MRKPPLLSAHRLYGTGSRISQQQHQQQKRCLQSTTTKSQTSDRKAPGRIIFDDLKPTDLAAYWDTEPPLQSDLQAAQRFFAPSRHSPVKLFSAAQFRTIPGDSKEPEVAFLGRSNVGKSSLINAILGEDICYASGTPGRTKIMNAFGIGGTKGGESKIVLLDMPGYGKASQSAQGVEIMKYLQKRKQLRRTYVLIDLLHGFKDTDNQILSLLRKYGISHQIIISKVDRILSSKSKKLTDFHVQRAVSGVRLERLQKLLEDVRSTVQPDPSMGEGPGALGEILSCCATRKVNAAVDKSYLGINAVRWSIMKATGFDGTIQPVGLKAPESLPSDSEPEPESKHRTGRLRLKGLRARRESKI
ncbi:hypothetical protein UA08_03772 [Talaromyces atroroseus]|uniref:EngB-type G domain-containing protein n=1 Tax=Talaromyces atroroseus TaxID=1441469 RepID=A0A225ATC0_TALAT|nr:hypothetical protein UA08_03772 [Talaromyces atroroseus]OKL61604.1 hypothetical protein UA08_03772 [Talaromyces atroroseus]